MEQTISTQEEDESGMGNGERKEGRTNEKQNREQKQKIKD